jgi:hypothetical protein
LWAANYVAFNGDAMRDLAVQFLAFAEKQRATVPLMIGHPLIAVSLLCTGDIAEAEALRSGDRALRSCRASSAGDAIFRGLQGGNLFLSVVDPEAALRDSDDALKNAREMDQAATLMYALGHAWIPGRRNLALEGTRNDEPRPELALAGRASDAIEILISGITAFRIAAPPGAIDVDGR